MIAILLGLGSGLCWGVGDFLGGLQSRRLPVMSVTLWSQFAGGVAIALVLISMEEPLHNGGIAWAALGGVCGVVGLLSFYRGLAVGPMSIVAPVSACGAIVPLIVSTLLGRLPGLWAILGIAVAMAGVVLVSLSGQEDGTSSANLRLGLLLAFAAATGFGFFFVFLDWARGAGTSPLWTVGIARLVSVALIVAVALIGRIHVPWPGSRIGKVALVGIFDTSANVLFVLAASVGNLAVVSVLGSVYPVSTVILARVVLKERLAFRQGSGVVLALAGVALMAVG